MVLLDLVPGPATPPWLPLLMVVVLLGLIGFLYWSMRRNLNRIDFDENETAAPVATPPDSPVSPLE
jgi:hypothetical protein